MIVNQTTIATPAPPAEEEAPAEPPPEGDAPPLDLEPGIDLKGEGNNGRYRDLDYQPTTLQIGLTYQY